MEFWSSGKHLVSVTPVGQKILTQIEEILALVDGIKHAATEFSDEDYGTLSIATTHTRLWSLQPLKVYFLLLRKKNFLTLGIF